MPERITINVSDGFFDGYLALPPGGQGPGMLVIQEIFGVNDHIRAMADKLAAEGYVVLAPDLFWRMKHDVELGYEGKDRDQAMDYYERFDETKGMSDLKHAADALRNHKACTGRIGAMGFCLGGKLAFRLAGATNLNVAISYYGGGIENHVSESDKIKCKILLHFGETDSHIPMSTVDKLKEAFQAKPNFAIEVYPGVGHGFNCDARSSYDSKAAELAWGRSIELLARELKS
ncbi:MAG: dienelactone hydrolase family protein [Cyanobacteria bacterium HKST-UBA02]|nr:dienelactone hydrolase family protein [Cyanobacteria bacterium HKST-UBA02]